MKFKILQYFHNVGICWLAFNYLDDFPIDSTANKFIDKNGQLTRNLIEDFRNDPREIFKIPEIFNTKRYLIQTIKKYYPDAKII